MRDHLLLQELGITKSLNKMVDTMLNILLVVRVQTLIYLMVLTKGRQ